MSMWWNQAQRADRQDARKRRLEIRRRLAEAGLTRGPFPRAVHEAPPGGPVARLGSALAQLSPVFAWFGRYLASRVDLLTASESLELAAIPDRGPATPPELLGAFLTEHMDREPLAVFEHFEPVPFSAGLAVEHYRARLASGAGVVVTVVRPDLLVHLATDLDLLPFLARSVQGGELDRLGLEAAAEDFRDTALRSTDLTRLAGALEQLGRELPAEALAVPRVDRRLTSPRVLIRERLEGATLAELFPGLERARLGLGAPGDAAGAGPSSEDLAARLCQLWLQQALKGRLFPVDFSARDVLVTPDQKIAWTGGLFAEVPSVAKGHLWEYMVAVSEQDPDRAVDALIREMEVTPAGGAEVLRQRFRQMVPFRDGGHAAVDDLAGYLFLEWRLAHEQGFRPRPHLLGFYRGLAHLSVPSRSLAWRGDPLLEGLEKAQVMAGFGELGQRLDFGQLGKAAEESFRLMFSMPQKLDQVLSLAASGRLSIQLDPVEPPSVRRRKNALSSFVALLAVMAAVVLVTNHLESSPALDVWNDYVAPGVLLLLGVMLLRAVFRHK